MAKRRAESGLWHPLAGEKTGCGEIAGMRVISQKQAGFYAVKDHPIGGDLPVEKPAELYAVLKDIAQVEAAIARKDGSEPSVLYLRATGSGCKAKGSRENVLGEMLADLGCRNIADREQAILEDMCLEAIIQADPEYIFAVLQGVDSSGAQAVLEQTLLSNPAWQNLRAVKEGRFYTLDHRLYNLKPNARWGEVYEALADILYNET